MNKAQKIILLIMVLVPILAHLCGAYIEVSLSISEWRQSTRNGVVVGFLVAEVFFLIALAMAGEDSEKKPPLK